MVLWKKGAKGVCPKCGFVIEDINDKFCTNCGWKISGIQAIKAKTEKENELTIQNHELKRKYLEENAEKHKNEFKHSIHDIKSSKDDFGQLMQDHQQSNQTVQKEMPEKTRKLLAKYGLMDCNHIFECTIEEMRYTTFSNTNERNVQRGFVGVYDDKLVIAKQGVFIKSDLGSRVIYFKNVAAIDYDERGIFGLSRNLIINMKSQEHVQLKNINNDDSLIVVDTFNKFMETDNKVEVAQNSISITDELLKAKELLDAGLLTMEEFEKLKQKLLQ